jgi:CRP-like cAMP-binding protein
LADATRAVSLPVVELPMGEWRPADVRAVSAHHGRLLGCLIVTGLVTREVTLAKRTSTLIYGPRDLLSLDGLTTASLHVDVRFNVLAPALIALLDDSFLAAGQRWPQLTGKLIDTATSQLGRMSADQAISQLPRVEDRLIALFWHFADRWGRRRSDDIVVSLPLTHEALGRLIGARRPTVSLGLRQLADNGLLRRSGEDWILSVTSLDALGVQPVRVKPTPRPVEPLPSSQRAELTARLAALRVELAEQRAMSEKAIMTNRAIREQVLARRAAAAAEPVTD